MLIFKDHFGFMVLTLCFIAALSAWDRAEGSGKRTESFTKIIHGQKKSSLSFFFTKMTSTVNRMISDSEVRQILI